MLLDIYRSFLLMSRRDAHMDSKQDPQDQWSAECRIWLRGIGHVRENGRLVMKWTSSFVLALGLVAVWQPSAKAQCTTTYSVSTCNGPNYCYGEYATPGPCNMSHGAS